MGNEIYKKTKQFILLYLQHQQTWLVEELFKMDWLSDMPNFLYNQIVYKGFLSTGSFEVSATSLDVLVKNIRGRIIEQEQLPQSNKRDSVISKLEEDILTLENVEPLHKTIYEWYLVPYWLAEQLF